MKKRLQRTLIVGICMAVLGAGAGYSQESEAMTGQEVSVSPYLHWIRGNLHFNWKGLDAQQLEGDSYLIAVFTGWEENGERLWIEHHDITINDAETFYQSYVNEYGVIEDVPNTRRVALQIYEEREGRFYPLGDLIEAKEPGTGELPRNDAPAYEARILEHTAEEETEAPESEQREAPTADSGYERFFKREVRAAEEESEAVEEAQQWTLSISESYDSFEDLRDALYYRINTSEGEGLIFKSHVVTDIFGIGIDYLSETDRLPGTYEIRLIYPEYAAQQISRIYRKRKTPLETQAAEGIVLEDCGGGSLAEKETEAQNEWSAEESPEPRTEQQTEEDTDLQTDRQTEEDVQPWIRRQNEESPQPRTEQQTGEDEQLRTEQQTEEDEQPQTEQQTEENAQPQTDRQTEEPRERRAEQATENTAASQAGQWEKEASEPKTERETEETAAQQAGRLEEEAGLQTEQQTERSLGARTQWPAKGSLGARNGKQDERPSEENAETVTEISAEIATETSTEAAAETSTETMAEIPVRRSMRVLPRERTQGQTDTASGQQPETIPEGSAESQPETADETSVKEPSETLHETQPEETQAEGPADLQPRASSRSSRRHLIPLFSGMGILEMVSVMLILGASYLLLLLAKRSLDHEKNQAEKQVMKTPPAPEDDEATIEPIDR